MDSAGHANRQGHNTVLLQDFNVPEPSKPQFRNMIEANPLLQQVKKESGQAIRIFSFPTEERIALIGWCDAALQNRIDGGRTKRFALHMLFCEGLAG